MGSSRADIATSIVFACHRMAGKGFVAATDGNVSARLPNGNVLVTPSSVNKGIVGESMLVEVRTDGTPVTLSRSPSTELGMHLFIYRERPDVQAVVHGHPPYATGFAVARLPLGENVLPEVILGLGHIPLAPYATPSTKEVADSLAPHVRSSDAVLMSNHGVVAYGKDVENAYDKLEKVEHAAQIMFVARLLGGEHRLTNDEVERLRRASSTSGYSGPASPHPAGDQQQELSEEEIKRLIRTVLSETKMSRS